MAEGRDSGSLTEAQRERISRAATYWVERMRDPRVNEADKRAFILWFRASRHHRTEYLRMTRLMGDLKGARLRGLLADDQAKVIDLYGGPSRPVEHRAENDPSGDRWRLAAVALVAIVVASVLLVSRDAWLHRAIATDLGEWQSVALEDGSTIRMGPNTSFRQHFDARARAIYLLKGEAYFQVAKDPARPFLVNAERWSVEAVGTQFAVAHRRDGLRVTVAEGVVSVAPIEEARTAGGRPSSVTTRNLALHAGEQITVSRVWPVAPAHVAVDYELAWVKRRFAFQHGDTVAKAIEEFNSRNRVQIELDDATLGDLQIRGQFDAADPAAFAQAVGRRADVRAIRESALAWRLEKE